MDGIVLEDKIHMDKPATAAESCPVCGAATVPACPVCDGGRQITPFFGDIDSPDAKSGRIIIGASGLILDTDGTSAALLGIERIALIEKPFTLFIQAEDLVDFFIHRNALFATRNEQNFEIRLRRKGCSAFNAKLKCTLIRNWKGKIDAMQVSLRDYTRRRRALDLLARRLDIENITRTLTARLIRCPARDIDATINHELKTLAMFTEVERTYLGVVDEKATGVTLTHEWCAPDTVPVRKPAGALDLNNLPGLKETIRQDRMLQVADVTAESGRWHDDLESLHLAETRSFAYFVLQLGRRVGGVIGYDACDKQDHWGSGERQLFQFAGQAFLNAIRRRQNETDWLNRHRRVQTVSPDLPERVAPVPDAPPSAGAPATFEIQEITETGELHHIFDITADQREKLKTPQWQYVSADTGHASPEMVKVPIIDEKMMITCPQCMRQDPVGLDRFKAFNKTITATCPCGFAFDLTPEKRSFYRKSVDLEGVFLQIKSRSLVSDSAGYSGKIRIANISKNGIGFHTEGSNRLLTGDRLRVKFTLDNRVRSKIVKQIRIKNVNKTYVGGQFLGSDKNDITLGFYLM